MQSYLICFSYIWTKVSILTESTIVLPITVEVVEMKTARNKLKSIKTEEDNNIWLAEREQSTCILHNMFISYSLKLTWNDKHLQKAGNRKGRDNNNDDDIGPNVKKYKQ